MPYHVCSPSRHQTFDVCVRDFWIGQEPSCDVDGGALQHNILGYQRFFDNPWPDTGYPGQDLKCVALRMGLRMPEVWFHLGSYGWPQSHHLCQELLV
jgi:hypothetical protein